MDFYLNISEEVSSLTLSGMGAPLPSVKFRVQKSVFGRLRFLDTGEHLQTTPFWINWSEGIIFGCNSVSKNLNVYKWGERYLLLQKAHVKIFLFMPMLFFFLFFYWKVRRCCPPPPFQAEKSTFFEPFPYQSVNNSYRSWIFLFVFNGFKL